MRRGPRSSDCSFIFLLSDSAIASVVDQDECQKALDNLLNSFQDVMDLQAKVGLIFLVILCNYQNNKLKQSLKVLVRCLASLPRSQRISWENNERTKLTIEPSPKAKAVKYRGPMK